jgi:RimJ/RimL family protein N-acetyltransferase
VKRIVIGPEVVAFVDKANRGSPDPYAVGIGLEKDGELIAGVKFDNWNHASVCMHVAAIGKQWMTREYLWYCFHYPFVELKATKILGLVAESNHDARRFDEALGFVLEYAIQGAHPDGALLIYTMTPEQCRFIKGRYARPVRQAKEPH